MAIRPRPQRCRRVRLRWLAPSRAGQHTDAWRPPATRNGTQVFRLEARARSCLSQSAPAPRSRARVPSQPTHEISSTRRPSRDALQSAPSREVLTRRDHHRLDGLSRRASPLLRGQRVDEAEPTRSSGPRGTVFASAPALQWLSAKSTSLSTPSLRSSSIQVPGREPRWGLRRHRVHSPPARPGHDTPTRTGPSPPPLRFSSPQVAASRRSSRRCRASHSFPNPAAAGEPQHADRNPGGTETSWMPLEAEFERNPSSPFERPRAPPWELSAPPDEGGSSSCVASRSRMACAESQGEMVQAEVEFIL